MSVPPSSMEDRIKAWLETQGYPLEMELARLLQAEGANVVQSDYYADPKTNESREIDVAAFWDTTLKNLVVRLNFTFECKSSKDKPWLLFVSDHAGLSEPASIYQRAASELGRMVLRRMALFEVVQGSTLFKLPPDLGYSVTQAFTSGNDACYAAISGVGAAVAAQAARDDYQSTAFGGIDFVQIFFPVVVTEARLFTTKLRSDGLLDLAEIGFGALLWRNPVAGMPHTIIHIVSRSALPQFVQEIGAAAKSFLKLCEGELLEPLKDIQEERRRLRLLKTYGGT